MKPQDYYVKVLKDFANFNGRARRSEYWYFVLFNTIASIILNLVGKALGTEILSSIYSLGVLVPSIAVVVRRFHDVGRSGWQVFISYVAIIILAMIPIFVAMRNTENFMISIWFWIPLVLVFAGSIWMIIVCATDGMKGANEYGPDPKGNYDDSIDQIGQ